MAENKLPFSPTARAFFAALDGSKDGAETKQSETIKKRIQALGWRNRYSQDDSYPIQVASDSFQVRQVQRGEIEGTYGTGATVWPASLVLIKYLEKSGLLAGKHVVDLGAGTGVTSIAAALLGAASCICTDGEEAVVRLARDNVRAAALGFDANIQAHEIDTDTTIMFRGCPISTQTYWWGTGLIRSENRCDVILVSDCVLPKLYPIAPLVEALDQLLRVKGSHDAAAYLSYEYRYFPEYDPKEKFMQLCEEKDLTVTLIPQSEQHSVYSLDDVEIWKVTVPKPSNNNTAQWLP